MHSILGLYEDLGGQTPSGASGRGGRRGTGTTSHEHMKSCLSRQAFLVRVVTGRPNMIPPLDRAANTCTQ